MAEHATVADRIRTLREHEKLTQADFSAAVGTSRSYISRIEKAHDVPGRNFLMAVASEFSVSLDWLLHGHGDMRPSGPVTENEALLLYAFRNMPTDEAETHLKLMLQRANKETTKES